MTRNTVVWQHNHAGDTVIVKFQIEDDDLFQKLVDWMDNEPTLEIIYPGQR